ncbi:MAG: hypothetical protein WCS92_00585 [Candidatus Babeliales bacterium]
MKFVKISIFLLLIFKSLSSMARDEGLTYKSLDLIEYSTENFLKILEPSKKPGIFFVDDGNFVCFEREGASDFCYHFEKTLFSDDDNKLYDSAVQDFLEKNGGEVACFFSDVWPDLKNPRWAQIESQIRVPNRVYERAFYSDNELERREAIKIMGCKFKIHLQVKPEYLISFISHFFKILYKDPKLRSIKLFKVVDPNLFSAVTSQNFPVIVVYVPIFYESNPIKRSEILDSFIDAINDYYAEFISKIAWTSSEPRFNYKINDLIYIAGSEGSLKIYLKLRLEQQDDPEESAQLRARIFDVFTPDFKFIRGFEYIPKNQR